MSHATAPQPRLQKELGLGPDGAPLREKYGFPKSRTTKQTVSVSKKRIPCDEEEEEDVIEEEVVEETVQEEVEDDSDSEGEESEEEVVEESNSNAGLSTSSRGPGLMRGIATSAGEIKYDIGVTPTDANTFSCATTIQWVAEGGKAFNGKIHAKLLEADLSKIFRPVLKNPDAAISGQPIADFDLRHVCIHKVDVTGVQSDAAHPLTVTVESKSGFESLNTHVIPHRQNSKCMMKINSGANIQTGTMNYNIIDNRSVINSKTYATFGHTSVDRFMQDISYDKGRQGKVLVKKDSQLAKLIAENAKVLQADHPEWRGIARNDLITRENKVQLPAEVVADALKRYNDQIKPLLRGVVDATQEVKFLLEPLDSEVSNRADRSLDGMKFRVSLDLYIEFSFPTSALNKYGPVAPEPVLEDPKESFMTLLTRALHG